MDYIALGLAETANSKLADTKYELKQIINDLNTHIYTADPSFLLTIVKRLKEVYEY